MTDYAEEYEKFRDTMRIRRCRGKPLSELSLEEYNALKSSGMFWERYPEATGSYEEDCNMGHYDDFFEYERKLEKSDCPRVQDGDETRMDIVGQNGNTGEHYVKPNKYLRTITTSNGIGDVDVYDVLHAFEVGNPALQHALKKMLCAGRRGYKDFQQDIDEAIQALERAKSLPPQPF